MHSCHASLLGRTQILIQTRLQGPHVTALYGCFDDEASGSGFIVLEDCQGGDLAGYIDSMGDEACASEEEVVAQVRLQGAE